MMMTFSFSASSWNFATMPKSFAVAAKPASRASIPAPVSERKLTRMNKRPVWLSSNCDESVMLQPFSAR